MRKLTSVKTQPKPHKKPMDKALLRIQKQNQNYRAKEENTVFMKKQQVNRRIRYPPKK